jgi:Core-2/I-Branching enzyme
MSNDFRSLLSTFEAATGNKPTSSQNTPKIEKDNPQSPKKLLDLTTQLWNYSQIRQSAEASKIPSVLDDERPIHVAVCLCIVNDLPHERVWEYWCGQGNARITADLYLHAKHREAIRSDYARAKLLRISHSPNWNDVRVVHAMMSLVEEALKNPKMTHILFGTESCIPICPLNEVQLQHGRSYVRCYGQDQCSRFDEQDVWDVLTRCVPLQAIHKALPGWCCLCRSHAQEILNVPNDHLEGQQLYDAFGDCWAPEEAFFPTALALLGLLAQTENKALTYAEWNNRAKNHKDRAHPLKWDEQFSRDLVQDLRQVHGCIILRKVMSQVPIRAWLEAVEKREVVQASIRTKRTAENDIGRVLQAPPSRKTRSGW